jgi:hypothetical protein
MPPAQSSLYDHDLAEEISSNSALRFIYMDEDAILSQANHSMHTSSTTVTSTFNESMNISMSSIDYHHHSHNYPLSPTLDRNTKHSTFRSCESEDSVSSYDSAAGKQRRTSIRKKLTNSLISPVRAAKDKISSPSPRKQGSHKLTSSKRRNHNNWQKQLNLPPGVTEDEAIAVLLAKELTMLDF